MHRVYRGAAVCTRHHYTREDLFCLAGGLSFRSIIDYYGFLGWIFSEVNTHTHTHTYEKIGRNRNFFEAATSVIGPPGFSFPPHRSLFLTHFFPLTSFCEKINARTTILYIYNLYFYAFEAHTQHKLKRLRTKWTKSVKFNFAAKMEIKWSFRS